MIISDHCTFNSKLLKTTQNERGHNFNSTPCNHSNGRLTDRHVVVLLFSWGSHFSTIPRLLYLGRVKQFILVDVVLWHWFLIVQKVVHTYSIYVVPFLLILDSCISQFLQTSSHNSKPMQTDRIMLFHAKKALVLVLATMCILVATGMDDHMMKNQTKSSKSAMKSSMTPKQKAMKSSMPPKEKVMKSSKSQKMKIHKSTKPKV